MKQSRILHTYVLYVYLLAGVPILHHYTHTYMHYYWCVCTWLQFVACQLFQSTGMIKSGRLLFTRKSTAPSIPTPGQSYGYDEAGDGNLTPQPLPPQDSTMGPAYYDVSHVQT